MRENFKGRPGSLGSRIHRKWASLTDGGNSALWRAAAVLLLVPLAFPAVLVIRLLRPLITIRFTGLASHRIGHFAGNTEVYLCERDADLYGRRNLDIFYYDWSVCNGQLARMWKRVLRVSALVQPLALVNRWLPGGAAHRIEMPRDSDVRGVLRRFSPHLSFTAEEETRGREALAAMGLPDGAEFVCFFSRDSAYLEATYREKDWSYHSYENSSIQANIPAMEEMVRRGYSCFRMGSVVSQALESDNPRIVDYSTRYRSEFLDLYLSARCRFFVCGPSGITALPMVFRRPIVHTNYIPLGFLPNWNPQDLMIPKKLWSREKGRLLSFGEMFSPGINSLINAQEYQRLGLEVIDNSPEEILDAAVEMDERLRGAWRPAQGDEELQERFWSLFRSPVLKDCCLRIGASFLRQNEELLS